MCLETTTMYSNCEAVRTHLDVCAAHIEHTRQQIDNKPCPNFHKTSHYVTHTTRCNCRDAKSMGRLAGYDVSVSCVRQASKGYGENGSTWSFEKSPDLSLKKKKDRAMEKVKEVEEDAEVKIKMEEGTDVEGCWAGLEAIGGFGGATGRSASSGRAEDAIRRNQMMKEWDYQQAKKVKVENNSEYPQ